MGLFRDSVDFSPYPGYTVCQKEVISLKKNEILSLAYQLASPITLILLGIILLFRPDTAAVLISRLIGWGFFAVGIGFGIAALVSRGGDMGKIVGALCCVAAGSFLMKNPLWLARGIGRVLGILLMLRGGRDFFLSRRNEGKILSLICAVLGMVLVVLPMTVSRWVFSLCGLVMTIVGVVMLLERLKERKLLDDSDPNIIDAL